jgi:hypothetical protein
MYALTVSVNGETTRSVAFASIVDAANDYADTIDSGLTAFVPFIGTGYATPGALDGTTDHYADALTIVRGGFTAATWDVPNVASDAGDGPTESDRIMVSVQNVPTDDVESDGIPVTYSRAVVIPDAPVLTAEDIEMIASAVERAQESVTA